tara:strand:+ start:131 stop:796 length:666 start_codon:yes stop_codon:yes gene_type:complete
MKNLSEEVNRIKKIISINEQCGADKDQCERDLEGLEYKVFSPQDLKSTCEDNPTIKCVSDALSTVSDMSISSVGSSTKDCYVLVKSNNKTVSGLPRFMITFYADNQVVISVLLGEKNNDNKLLYRSKYECDGTNLNIKGGLFKYIGIRKSGSADMVNKTILKSDGSIMMVTSTETGPFGIPEGELMATNYLTYYLNQILNISGNVKTNGLNITEILTILTH